MTVTTERATPGTFPRPIPLGERAVGWLESEMDSWIEACLRKRETRAS
jgi:prophage regulatory protein